MAAHERRAIVAANLVFLIVGHLDLLWNRDAQR
jgi:hypothetical protein